MAHSQFRVRINTSYVGSSERTIEAATKLASLERALLDWAGVSKIELSARRLSDDGRLSYSAKATASLFPNGRDYTDVTAFIV